jgi:hypothetical protein
MTRRIAVIIALNSFLVMACCCGGGPPVVYEKADADLQAKRKEVIDDLLNKDRLFHKIEYHKSSVDAWVTPRFMLLDIDTKRKFCNIVFCHAFELPRKGGDHRGKALTLYHSVSGKEVGSFNLDDGLQMR